MINQSTQFNKLDEARKKLNEIEQLIFESIELNRKSDEFKDVYLDTLYDLMKDINQIRKRL